MDFHFAFASLMPVTMDFHCSLKPKGQSGPKQCSVWIAIDGLVTKSSGETVVPPLKLMHDKMPILSYLITIFSLFLLTPDVKRKYTPGKVGRPLRRIPSMVYQLSWLSEPFTPVMSVSMESSP